MKRVWEWCKTLLIILLSCSLTLLALAALPADTIRGSETLSRLLQPVAPLLGLPQAELAYVEVAPSVMDAAKPVAISVRGGAGRESVMGNFSLLDTTFESLGGALGRALDTAQEISPASEAQVEAALSELSVCFFYSDALPVELLASWLGAELASDAAAACCALAVEDGGVALYLVGEDSLRAQTALDAGELEELLDGFRPDGSLLGFESGLSVSPLSLIPGQNPEVPGGAAVNPCTGRGQTELATALGFNPYGDSRYTDSQGTTHFSEASLALQVDADGWITMTSAAEDRFRAADGGLQSLVETARQLTQLVNGGDFGAARLYLTGVSQSEEGETVCVFDYFLSGYPVALADHAATVTFRGQRVTELRMLARRFVLGEQMCYPLPVKQAAAILTRGHRLQLQYRISGSNLEAGWKQ